jgi:hypothetical protein
MLNANLFWANTKQKGDCQIWTGQINEEPLYGVFPALGGRLIAHRVAYELAIGNLPLHAHVGRTCNDPLCVAPKHLFLQNANKSLTPELDAKRKISSQVEDKDGCWFWRGSPPKCLAVTSGIKILPRAIYEIYNGEIARGKEVCSTCKVAGCLNPEHMSLIDKAELGKTNSKLTFEEVKEIRKLAHTGEYGLIELGERFNTSRQTIYAIVYNIGWHDASYVPPQKMPRRPRCCRKGHVLSGNNVITLESGSRKCKICYEELLANKKSRKTLDERFWEKVYKSNDGCWDWTAYHHKGWGYFNINKTPHLAHRVAYELTYGEIPEGAKVLHTCNNDLCVRPDHLYLQSNRQAAK